MSLKFLLDENLRGVLWRAIGRHNSGGVELLDAIRIGDSADLPLGSHDPEILIWAEREQRIFVSRDAASLFTHLANHLQAGNHSPGIFMVRRWAMLSQVVAFVVEVAYRSSAADWQDRIEYIP